MTTHSEAMTLTQETLVERKLAVLTVVISGILCFTALLFLSLVLYFDFETKRAMVFRQMDVEKREKWTPEEYREYILSHSSAVYSGLLANWLYFLMGVSLTAIFAIGFFSLYKAVTIRILLWYHCLFGLFVFYQVLFTLLALIISNSSFIIEPLGTNKGIFYPFL